MTKTFEEKKSAPSRRMQCKDIPDLPVLEFLRDLPPYEGMDTPRWACWFGDTFDNSVTHAMPKGTPDKLVLGKMRTLMRRKLVDGCDCGCRGDFVLTVKGYELLSKLSGEAL